MSTYECSITNPKKQLEFYRDLSEQLQVENKQLKKQLEEKQKPLKGIFAQVNDDMLLRNCGAMQSEIDEYKSQQKEFIEYLEYQVKLQEELNDKHLATGFEEILSKYKEIIGGKDEK